MVPYNNFKYCTLAVCRDEAALHSVLSLQGVNSNLLVIASDDLRVHQLVEENAKLKVIYYNQMEPLFTVAPYVLQILEAVNRWLRILGDARDLPEDLLYWEQHLEGGDVTQRIQDAVLEARSCFAIIDQFQPTKLIIGDTAKPYWEDQVVIACASQRNIPIKKLKSFNPYRVLISLWQQLRPVAKEMYHSIMTIDSLFRRKASGYGSTSYGKYVAIQMCSSAKKYLIHVLPLLDAFERRKRKAVAVTWEIGRAAKLLRIKGYNVVELESWLSASIIFHSWWLAFKGIRRAGAKIDFFLSDREKSEYGPLVRAALLPVVRSFFLCELPQRIRLDAACRAFFTHNPPVAACLWTRILTQGVIAYRALKAIDKIPLLFWQPAWPYQLPWPYLRHDVPVDLIFSMSNSHRDLLKSTEPSRIKIEVAGNYLLSPIKEFASRNTPDQSRAALGIGPHAKFVVFCDAQIALGGYLTSSEQALLINAVINFSERFEDVCVLIKPHPGNRHDQLEIMFKGRGNGRIIWIPKQVLPYEGLNAANVVLTKFSTLVAQAMAIGVPSICVLLDQDMRWAIYEDAVDYALSIAELNGKLEALRNKNYYLSWANAIRERQVNYVARHLQEPVVEYNEYIASRVNAYICGVDRNHS